MPAELGNLSNLDYLLIHDNQLSGRLPQSLTNLTTLDTFTFVDTGLCAPADEAFQNWLRGLPNSRISSGNLFGPNCAGSTPPPEPVPPPTPSDELFERYDSDGSGSIEIAEVVQAVQDYADGILTIEELVIVVRLYAGG